MEQMKTIDMLKGEFAMLDWLRYEIDGEFDGIPIQSLEKLQNEIQTNLSLLEEQITVYELTDELEYKRYQSAKERLEKFNNLIEEKKVSSVWEIRVKMIEHMEEVNEKIKKLEIQQLH